MLLVKAAGLAAAFATKLWVAAQWLLNVALTANPIGVIIMAIAALVAAIVFLIAYWDEFVAAISKINSAINSAMASAWASLKSFASGFLSLGADMINGLVAGIKGAAGAVVNAITGVVSGGISAAKSALGIASPSKVFENMGAMSALGYEEGFADVGASIPAMSASAVAPSIGGGSSVTQNNSSTFNVTEAQSAEDTARMVKRMQLTEMASAFEQMAVEVGA
jgi:hypothetical protein